MRKQLNIRKKSNENLQKRRFPAFSAGKNFSQKSDSAMFWAFLTHIFVQKIRKNKWWYLEKIPKNRFFRYISGIFGQKWIFSGNRTLPHFRYWHFASVCKISWKNIKYSSRNSRNTVFPAKISRSGYKNQFYWPLNHAWWFALL